MVGTPAGCGSAIARHAPVQPPGFAASGCGVQRGGTAQARYVCETVFRHVWLGGREAADAQRLQALTLQLAPQQDANGEAVKAQLKANTEAALARKFGVPTFEVDGKLFWGLDALPTLQAYLAGDAWFGEHWDAAERVGRYVP